MITAASFLVTEKCNLACTYCFESKERACKPNMSKETAEAGLFFLFNSAIKHQKDKVDVILFGGEPLLNSEVCEHILSAGYTFQNKYGVKFGINVITNATVLTDGIELMLYRWAAKLPGFTCQLSIDGAEESQNLYRVYPDGTGSFKVAEKNVEKFRNIFGRRLNVHGCINKKTLPHLYENYKLIADEWKPGSVWFMPVHTEDWQISDVEEYDKQMGLIFQDLKNKKTMSYYAPINKLLPVKPGMERHNEKTCGAGVTFVTITGDGELFPCHNIYFNDPQRSTYCGNVWDGITKPEVLEPFAACSPTSLGCSDCENTKCYRCIADNWVHGGNISAQVGKPVRCLMSGIETKYQRLARDYSDKMLRPADKNRASERSAVDGKIRELQGNVEKLTRILYQGLGGMVNDA